MKNVHEYQILRSAIEDVIDARESKDRIMSTYRIALGQVRLVTEASDVLLQLYMACKQTGKICSIVTYDWLIYKEIINELTIKKISELKHEAVETKKT